MVVQEVEPDGNLGAEVRKEGKTGIVRELECGVVMSLDVAEGVKDWLIRHIDTVKKRIENEKQDAK